MKIETKFEIGQHILAVDTVTERGDVRIIEDHISDIVINEDKEIKYVLAEYCDEFAEDEIADYNNDLEIAKIVKNAMKGEK